MLVKFQGCRRAFQFKRKDMLNRITPFKTNGKQKNIDSLWLCKTATPEIAIAKMNKRYVGPPCDRRVMIHLRKKRSSQRASEVKIGPYV